jgi:hypothetical protein
MFKDAFISDLSGPKRLEEPQCKTGSINAMGYVERTKKSKVRDSTKGNPEDVFFLNKITEADL